MSQAGSNPSPRYNTHPAHESHDQKLMAFVRDRAKIDASYLELLTVLLEQDKNSICNA
ncbi:MAG: hypothetical protein KTR14_01835 [Vampirovibrio sp.]|nr:hypothetical protein [Vampirovibrio sp.]